MLLNELRQIEKIGARERALIRKQCEEEIAEIRCKKDEAIGEIDRQHKQTMAAMKADHEAKMQTLNSKSEEIRAAIEEAKQNNDFSKVCELLKQMAESIA